MTRFHIPSTFHLPPVARLAKLAGSTLTQPCFHRQNISIYSVTYPTRVSSIIDHVAPVIKRENTAGRVGFRPDPVPTSFISVTLDHQLPDWPSLREGLHKVRVPGISAPDVGRLSPQTLIAGPPLDSIWSFPCIAAPGMWFQSASPQSLAAEIVGTEDGVTASRICHPLPLFRHEAVLWTSKPSQTCGHLPTTPYTQVWFSDTPIKRSNTRLSHYAPC